MLYEHIVFKDPSNQKLLVDTILTVHEEIRWWVEEYPDIAPALDFPLVFERLIRKHFIKNWPDSFYEPQDHTVDKDVPCGVQLDIDYGIEIRTRSSLKNPYAVKGQLTTNDRMKENISKARSSFLLFISYFPFFDAKTYKKNPASFIREVSFGYIPETAWKQDGATKRTRLSAKDKKQFMMQLYRYKKPKK